jgi:hypothetical protein
MEREQAPALQRPDETGGDLDRLSSVQVLARLASIAKLFRSADGRFYAEVPVGDRLEIYRLSEIAPHRSPASTARAVQHVPTGTRRKHH